MGSNAPLERHVQLASAFNGFTATGARTREVLLSVLGLSTSSKP